MNYKKLIDQRAAILEASFVGMFKKQPPQSELCRHVSCGYVDEVPCKIIDYPRHYMKEAHVKAGCLKDWCAFYEKRPKPPEFKQRRSCNRFRYIPYGVELAQPNIIPEIIAISMKIAYDCDIAFSMVALYDTVDERWHDDWWMITQNGNLAQKVQFPWRTPPPKPIEVHAINEVIELFKAAL